MWWVKAVYLPKKVRTVRTPCTRHPKNFATKHIKGSVHWRLKKEGKAVNFVLGLAALKMEQ